MGAYMQVTAACQHGACMHKSVAHAQRRRTAYRGAGLPWWCTSFQAPPCFSKTFVAAILRQWECRQGCSASERATSAGSRRGECCSSSAPLADPGTLDGAHAPAAPLPRLGDLHARHKRVAAAAGGRPTAAQQDEQSVRRASGQPAKHSRQGSSRQQDITCMLPCMSHK